MKPTLEEQIEHQSEQISFYKRNGAETHISADGHLMDEAIFASLKELAALRVRLMEPDEEMIKAGSENITSVGTDSHIRPTVRIWKAMSAVALNRSENET